MKTPHVVSVQHTGSNFIGSLLDCEIVHATKSIGHLKIIADNHVIVTPLRDPRSVWESWIARNNKLTIHYKQQWDTLKHLDAYCKIFYIPIDLPERDECIQALSEELGRELRPDWDVYIRCGHERPRFSYDGTTPLSDDAWHYMYNLPMIKRFYEEGK